jgi:hypothetical protein
LSGDFKMAILTVATVTFFNWRKYQKTGCSFGFASAFQFKQKILIPTELQAKPMIACDQITFFENQARSETRLTKKDVRKLARIMILVNKDEMGRLSGRWCPGREWDLAVRNLNRIREQKESQSKIFKELKERRQIETDPDSVEEAEQSGWKIFKAIGRMIIMHRIDGNGVKRSRTFHLPGPRAEYFHN